MVELISDDAPAICLLLATSIGAHGRDELKTPQGMVELANDMRTRLNVYLEAEGLKPVASVAIQDFWHAEP